MKTYKKKRSTRDLIEAFNKRKSIRAYKPDPVPVNLIKEVLDIATHAPSSVNSQPWEFFIITGEVLDRLKKAYVEQVDSGIQPNPEIAIPDQKGSAPGLEGIYRRRQVELAKQLFRLLDITKEDKKKMIDWHQKAYRFYDAPAVIVCVIDRQLTGGWPLVDIGVIAYSITLTAMQYGLGTCIMRGIVDYPEQLREVASIPDAKQTIVGIAMGYPDTAHPANALETEREPLENIVTVVG